MSGWTSRCGVVVVGVAAVAGIEDEQVAPGLVRNALVVLENSEEAMPDTRNDRCLVHIVLVAFGKLVVIADLGTLLMTDMHTAGWSMYVALVLVQVVLVQVTGDLPDVARCVQERQ